MHGNYSFQGTLLLCHRADVHPIAGIVAPIPASIIPHLRSHINTHTGAYLSARNPLCPFYTTAPHLHGCIVLSRHWAARYQSAKRFRQALTRYPEDNCTRSGSGRMRQRGSSPRKEALGWLNGWIPPRVYRGASTAQVLVHKRPAKSVHYPHCWEGCTGSAQSEYLARRTCLAPWNACR